MALIANQVLTSHSIRFAAPPTDSNRWQAPVAPQQNRSSVISASDFGSVCPQGPDAGIQFTTVNQTGASEDCLFLNVYSPANSTSPLPVLVWIHGGGYGEGNGQEDLSTIINANNNSFIGVAIQYRVGQPPTHLPSTTELTANSLGRLDSCLLMRCTARAW